MGIWILISPILQPNHHSTTLSLHMAYSRSVCEVPYIESDHCSLLYSTVYSDRQLVSGTKSYFPTPAWDLETVDRTWDLLHAKKHSAHWTTVHLKAEDSLFEISPLIHLLSIVSSDCSSSQPLSWYLLPDILTVINMLMILRSISLYPNCLVML